jgi:acetyl esterase/lipase
MTPRRSPWVIRFSFTLLLSFLFLCVIDIAAQIPLDTSYTVSSTYKKLIKKYPHIKPVADREPGDLREIKDVVYFTIAETPFGRRDLRADIFIPNATQQRSPAILMIHGGGWRSGNKSLNIPMARRLADEGFVVVSVEYRLSLEAKYPAAVQDIATAIRWTREHADDYQIDPNKIAIAGSSAGGQLASLIGAGNPNKTFQQVASTNSSSNVQAVIDMDGLLDFTNPESLAVERTENSADVVWLQGSYQEIPQRWKEASALHWVDKNAPPFLFINSSQTRFHAGCADMVNRLNGFGVYNEVHKLEDAPHSFWFFHPWFDPTVKYISDFLNKVFSLKKL